MSQETQKIEIVNDKRSGLGTASMVLGIIAIVGCWIPFLNIFSIILGFVGLFLGIPALITLLVKKKGSSGKIIAGLILCSLTLFIAFSMNGAATDAINESVDEFNSSMDEMSGNKTEDILKNDLDVKFGTYKTDGNQYFESGKLEVTVTNKSTESKSYSIKVEALDDSGTRIATDSVYANSLGAGQTAKYETFTFSDVDKLKTAKTFNVYEVSKY